jgi:anti-sigma factor RsiW
MRCRRVRSRLQPFLDGALTEQEARRIEQHASSCAACRLELEAVRALDRALSGEPLEEPPAELRAAIVSRATAKADRTRSPLVPRWLDGLTFAGFGLALLATAGAAHAVGGVSVTLLHVTINVASAAVVVLGGGVAILGSFYYGSQY